jgi:hypothetical protein
MSGKELCGVSVIHIYLLRNHKVGTFRKFDAKSVRVLVAWIIEMASTSQGDTELIQVAFQCSRKRSVADSKDCGARCCGQEIETMCIQAATCSKHRTLWWAPKGKLCYVHARTDHCRWQFCNCLLDWVPLVIDYALSLLCHLYDGPHCSMPLLFLPHKHLYAMCWKPLLTVTVPYDGVPLLTSCFYICGCYPAFPCAAHLGCVPGHLHRSYTALLPCLRDVENMYYRSISKTRWFPNLVTFQSYCFAMQFCPL